MKPAPYRISQEGRWWWVRATCAEARCPDVPLLCLSRADASVQADRLTREFERRRPRSGVLADLSDPRGRT